MFDELGEKAFVVTIEEEKFSLLIKFVDCGKVFLRSLFTSRSSGRIGSETALKLRNRLRIDSQLYELPSQFAANVPS